MKIKIVEMLMKDGKVQTAVVAMLVLFAGYLQGAMTQAELVTRVGYLIVGLIVAIAFEDSAAKFRGDGRTPSPAPNAFIQLLYGRKFQLALAAILISLAAFLNGGITDSQLFSEILRIILALIGGMTVETAAANFGYGKAIRP